MILPTPTTHGSGRPPTDLMSHVLRPDAPIIAKVVDAGPNDEDDDTTTNTYWVKLQRAKFNSTTRAVEFEDDTSGCLGFIERAVNIGEPPDSHSLPTSGICYVALWRVVEPSAVPIFTWVFSRTAVVIPIMIDNHTQDGTEKRWLYDWHMPTKPLSGYPTNIGPTSDSWSHVIGAVSGPSDTYGYAYNGCETINSNAPTQYGNGVVVADLPTGLDIVPVEPFTIHLALLVTPEDGGPVEAWFSSPNGITGSVDCP